MILIYTNDSTHSADCIKNCYQDNDIIVAKPDEPLSEKEKTFKAEASVREIIGKNNEQDVKGSIIIYFQKDSSLSSIGYGSQIVFKKPLTTPISIFQFHQFPVYFLLTNLIAVPFSRIVLLGELILCAVSFIPVVAKFCGLILNWLIWLLNSFIEHMETLPLSIWSNLQISVLQTICCFIIIARISMWIFF
ncbi:MAG TPA: ComEC/Rec2 family competence protein [Puia sp.]